MNLSQEFLQNGFVERIPVLNEGQTQRIRKILDRSELMLGEEIYEKKSPSETSWCDLKHPIQRIFQSLALHPKVLSTVSQVLGPNLLVRNGDIFIKGYSNQMEIGWHVDTPFSWPKSFGMLNCWIGLNDVDAQRGALQYIPGSHKHVFAREPASKRDLTLEADQLAELDLHSRVYNRMPKGHMSMHSFRTVHASGKNESTVRRIGLVLRFISADTAPDIVESGQVFLAQGSPGIWSKRLRNYFPISWNIQ